METDVPTSVPPPVPPYAPAAFIPPLPPRRCRHGRFWVAIILLTSALGGSLALNVGRSGGLGGCAGPGGRVAGGEDEFPQFTEKWSYGSGDVKVVRIAVEGVISRESVGSFFGEAEDMTETILKQVRAATNDEDVRAILLDVDSPGGVVTPSDEIYAALKRFRDSRDDRRVIAHVRDLAASGAYYIAMASDWIVAEPTALIGSIGVILQTVNFNALTQKIGIEDTTIKSGDNKDLLNPFRPVNPEHVKILQALVDSSYERFRGLVKEGRKFADGKMDGIADGSVFPAGKALELGMIDQIGYWEDAVEQVEKQLEADSVKIVRYHRESSLFQWLTEAESRGGAGAALRGLLPGAGGPKLMYLWKP